MSDTLHQRIVQKLIGTYYGSKLINNVDRGHYVECMIVLALGEEWNLTSAERGWAPWDIESTDGARLEVKQSTALQPWSVAGDAPQTRTQSFDIAFRKEPWTKGGNFPSYIPGRPADVYIFACHSLTDHAIADHRSPEQWRFIVVPERELPNQKTISINPLKKLAAETRYGQLAQTISATLSQLDELKANVEANHGCYTKTSRFDNLKPGE